MTDKIGKILKVNGNEYLVCKGKIDCNNCIELSDNVDCSLKPNYDDCWRNLILNDKNEIHYRKLIVVNDYYFLKLTKIDRLKLGFGSLDAFDNIEITGNCYYVPALNDIISENNIRKVSNLGCGKEDTIQQLRYLANIANRL